jgi:hypothetical protein
MHGVMKGTRTYDCIKQLRISDEGNQLYADIVFNPDKKGWFKRLFSSTQKTSPAFFEGIICDDKDFDYKAGRNSNFEKLESQGKLKTLCKFEGEWTSHLMINDEVVWQYVKLTPPNIWYVNNPLPSD